MSVVVGLDFTFLLVVYELSVPAHFCVLCDGDFACGERGLRAHSTLPAEKEAHFS